MDFMDNGLKEEIYKALESVIEQNTDHDLSDEPYKDKTQTEQQKARDEQITTLLKKYVEAYDNKITTQKNFRKSLFIGAAILAVLLTCVIIFVSIWTVFSIRTSSIDTTTMISIITVCVTLLTSIIGLFQIITRFSFPEDDEKYITSIVDSIQKNDLEHKKANMEGKGKAENKPEQD